jgi:rhamnogalacturonan endolyase
MNDGSAEPLLLDDHFAGLRPGPIRLKAQGPYLEMHAEPASPEDNTDGWHSRSGHWAVRGEGWVRADAPAGPVVESRAACTVFDSVVLVKGDPDWQDYRVETSLELLPPLPGAGWGGPAGVIFRFQDSQNYYAIAADRDGCTKLLRRCNNQWDVLAQARYAPPEDQPVPVRVEVRGARLQASLGECTLAARDSAMPRGYVGFLAARHARFGPVRVWPLGRERKALSTRRKRAAAAMRRKRARYPTPVLAQRWQTRGFGCGRQLRLGDLDGDGRLDFVLAQGGHKAEGIRALTAMTWQGQILWQIGEPAEDPLRTSADFPLQVHDVDGDGANEVVCVLDGRLRILDGRTGQEKASAPVPPAQKLPEEYRNNMLNFGGPWGDEGDALAVTQIAFADLAGRGSPRDILLKSNYHHIVALSPQLEPLWQYVTSTGHFPQCYDFDGDGREDVIAGHSRLSPDGKLLGRICMQDHQDAIYVGPLDEPGRGPVEVVMAGGDDGLLRLTPDFWLHQRVMGHVQRLAVGRFRTDLDGLQIGTVLFHGNPGIISLLDRTGKRIWSRDFPVVGATLQPVNWDGSGQELMILTGLRPSQGFEGGLIDGDGDLVVRLPDDGGPGMCLFAHDFDGDGLDELLAWDHQAMVLYRSEAAPPGPPFYRPIRPPLYNWSNFQCYWSRPRWV